MKPSIDCLKNLGPAQLQQLRIFIEHLGYRKAAERASEEFNQRIHKTALQRFMLRAAPVDFLDEENLDYEEATRQILKFAADGQPDFTASTVRTLEQLAFQLALTCTSMEEDMNALTKVTTMLCRFRNAAVRERMAAVQEAKLKIRQQELEKAGTDDSDDAKIRRLNEKIAEAFSLHPVLTAIHKAEEAGFRYDPSQDAKTPFRPQPCAGNPNEMKNQNSEFLNHCPNPQSEFRHPQSFPVPPTRKTQSTTPPHEP